MHDQFILNPFFMDEAMPELRQLMHAGAAWQINAPNVRGNDIMARIASVQKPLADRVRQVAETGKRPVVIGYDCCASIPTLAGLQRAGIDPVLVWLDAHGDFNTFQTSPSGYIFGMPLAMLCGLGSQQLTHAVSLRPLPVADVVLSDARDLDPAEHDLIKQHAVKWVRVIDKLLLSVPINRPIYVHFDTDIVDPSDSPAMLYQVPNGPPLNDLVKAAADLARARPIMAVSMTAWTPSKDVDKRSEHSCMRVLNALLQHA
jgi:arginase